jgi:capsular polysaccharide biosynthesis protein
VTTTDHVSERSADDAGARKPPPTGRAIEPEEIDRLDLRHIFAVVWKWRILVAAGVIFTLAASALILQATEPEFEAHQTLVFDQPGIVQGASSEPIEKINAILPTYARLAVSDRVMTAVKSRLGTSASVADLQERVIVRRVPETLALEILATDENASAAEGIAQAVTSALTDALDEVQDRAEVPEQARYILTPLDDVEASRPPRRQTRTMVLAAVLAFAVMSGLALILEFVERP